VKATLAKMSYVGGNTIFNFKFYDRKTKTKQYGIDTKIAMKANGTEQKDQSKATQLQRSAAVI
jgi:hypothetical protein